MRNLARTAAAVLGVVTVAAGGWALVSPESFAEAVNFPAHHHFLHDIGAFQLGIGAALLLATIWADGLMVALGGYLVAGGAHTAVHVVDRHLGGSTAQTVLIGALSLVAAAALVARWRQLGWVVGDVGPASPALAPLAHQKTIVLTTFRRNGTPVDTPVSIAVEGDRAYFRSFEKAGKTRRLRHNPAVTLAPSTMRGIRTGPTYEATARRLNGTEYAEASHALVRKHPLLHGVLVPLTHRLGRRKTGRTVHFELVF